MNHLLLGRVLKATVVCRSCRMIVLIYDGLAEGGTVVSLRFYN